MPRDIPAAGQRRATQTTAEEAAGALEISDAQTDVIDAACGGCGLLCHGILLWSCSKGGVQPGAALADDMCSTTPQGGVIASHRSPERSPNADAKIVPANSSSAYGT